MKKLSSCLLLAATIVLVSRCTTRPPDQGDKTSTPLVGTYWALAEIHGKTYTAGSDQAKKIYLRLSKEENRVEAQGSCNGIGGNYETKDPNRIKFSNLISTMMACEDLPWENEFKDVLNTADSYYITNDTLQLIRARMAPLAKFVAVDSNPNDK